MPVSLRYTGLPYRGALRRLTPLRPLATLSLITDFVNGLRGRICGLFTECRACAAARGKVPCPA
ncbi:hypothetical protein DDT54_09405 [Brenneria nigrifluens DSM 30175 = ATCC 13028]|uniref:Uncharacterized protein n=1 Tax=Brenneria nigrifluens DSM 30175 = ATCC 13028 TaxID=1121120 RepID=A0A2U1USF4_9GAMM|nr:hypothetical protein DDT54_09405 [Brenneria nigrifluens DSM 30175 = ATCC 13028]